jgi:hypothetical protein
LRGWRQTKGVGYSEEEEAIEIKGQVKRYVLPSGSGSLVKLTAIRRAAVASVIIAVVIVIENDSKQPNMP